MAYGVIFDLDGTLADTMDDLRTAINSMLTKLGYETRSKFDLLNFINNGARELVRRSLPVAVQTEEFIVESALNLYEQEYAKCFCEKTEAFPGIHEMLTVLKGQKFKLAVLSNKQDEFVKAIIEKLFGRSVFDFVMGKSELPHKPDPTSTLFVAKEMGVKPSKCIFIGDSDVDMKTAKNAGMRSIGVSWGYRNVDLLTEAGADYIAENAGHVVEHVNEIKQIIKLEKKLNKNKKHPRAENESTDKKVTTIQA